MARHVQLNPAEHSGLRVRMGYSADLGNSVMQAPVFPHEFRRVLAHYPIAFMRDGATGGFRPVALFGLEQGQNLFLTGRTWDADYVPIAARMAPFLIGRGADRNGQPRLDVHIDLDHPRIAQSGEAAGAGSGEEALFLQDGTASPLLQETARLLGEIHEAEQALPTFGALLEEWGLFEPFTLDVTLNDGTTGRLAGFHTIAEEKLQQLEAAALGQLHSAGALLPVFMAVASLSQFTALIARRNALLDGSG